MNAGWKCWNDLGDGRNPIFHAENDSLNILKLHFQVSDQKFRRVVQEFPQKRYLRIGMEKKAKQISTVRIESMAECGERRCKDSKYEKFRGECYRIGFEFDGPFPIRLRKKHTFLGEKSMWDIFVVSVDGWRLDG